jgi:hypothetical protein
MNVILPKEILASLTKQNITREVPTAVFDHFKNGVMRTVARGIFLPSLGDFEVAGKREESSNSSHPISVDLGRNQYLPHGLFVHEGEVTSLHDLSMIKKYFWGVSSHLEWEIWLVGIKRNEKGDTARYTEMLLRTDSFSEFLNHEVLRKRLQCLAGMYDALYVELYSLIKKRQEAFDDAHRAFVVHDTIRQMIFSHFY